MERKSSEAGSVSVTTTFAAASGPLLVTTIVYAIVLPCGAFVVDVVLVTLRSALAGAIDVVVVLAWGT